MANRIQIRRGSGVPTGNNLLQYELGWDTTNKKLYIKSGSGTASSDYTQISPDGLYLPLSGGIMTGNVIFNGETHIDYKITSKKEGSGAWAYAPFRTIGNDDAMFFTIGVYGNSNTLSYAYIGAGNYSSNLNLRVAPDGNVTAKKFVGPLEGIATQATQDGSGNVITTTYLPLTGGILTGNLTISKASSPTLVLKNTVMDTAAASISAEQYNDLFFTDKNDYINAFVQGAQYTNGDTSVILATRRRNTANDANVQNSLTLKIAASGTETVIVSNPAAWRSAIAAVNKAGDTMTGTLKLVSGSGFYAEGSPELYWFSGSASSYQKQATIFSNASTVNSKKVCERMYFREYSHNSSTGATIEKWDQYRLPTVASNKTSSDTYEILTSKDVITVEQGGTGKATKQQAVNNLLVGIDKYAGNMADNIYFLRSDSTGTSFGLAQGVTFYNYIKNKLKSDGNVLEKSTNYTLAPSDVGSFIIYHSNNDYTVTIPNNSNIPVGAEYTILRHGIQSNGQSADGHVYIQKVANIYITTKAGSSDGHYSSTTKWDLSTRCAVLIKKISADTWYMNGDHIAIQN